MRGMQKALDQFLEWDTLIPFAWVPGQALPTTPWPHISESPKAAKRIRCGAAAAGPDEAAGSEGLDIRCPRGR